MKKQILLIRHKHFSFTDGSVYKQLIKNFPDHEIVLFNVDDVHKKVSKLLMFVNLFHLAKEYGWDFITGQKKPRTVKTFFKSTRMFAGIYRKYALEHIKANNYEFVFQLQSLFDGSAPGVPHFVYSDHITIANYTYPDSNPRRYIRSKAFIEIEKSLYQHATLCFTMSTNISRLISDKYNVPAERVRCVYAGNNVQLLYDGNTKKYAAQHILFVGVDWERKGGPIMIEAFREVQKVLPDARLTIVGCSPKIDMKNVTIVGRVPLDKLPAYFNSATVFCLPTLREPFGLVFVESMLYRVPVVANNIGALPDMIEEGVNGFLINNNVQDYATALVRLLKNPSLCKKLGENGYLRARDRYTWDNVGEAIRKNIESAIPTISVKENELPPALAGNQKP